jgi:hypothetical protein
VAAFWEGHKKSSVLFEEICWEEPEKQKTRSCRAQELSRSSAQWRGWKRRQYRETSSIGAIKGQSYRKSVRQVVWGRDQRGDRDQSRSAESHTFWEPRGAGHPFAEARRDDMTVRVRFDISQDLHRPEIILLTKKLYRETACSRRAGGRISDFR